MRHIKFNRGKSIWLLGNTVAVFGKQIPSALEVFRKFMFYREVQKLSIRESAWKTINEVSSIFHTNVTKMRREDSLVRSIKRFYNQYLLIKKKSKFKVVAAKKKRKGFYTIVDRF